VIAPPAPPVFRFRQFQRTTGGQAANTVLDRFFDTPENMLIPIGMGLVICRQRLGGVTEEKIQDITLTFRAYAANPIPLTAPVPPTPVKH